VAKPVRPEFECHYVRRTLDRTERRRAIRQGYHDYQCFGWSKDPPFAMGDPLRWLWQNGAETAESIHQQRANLSALEETPGWT
jgi:hypothetical protein